jgi:succinate-semialdehyde dehydrogenase / glutarate-semialdehyde dehydrogenase
MLDFSLVIPESKPIVRCRMEVIQSVNPANGRILHEYPVMSDEEVAGIIESAHREWMEWRERRYEERAAHLRRAGGLLRERANETAKLMALEMGKPIRQGLSEVEKCAWVCDYYADNAAWMLAPEETRTDATRSYVTFNPLGVVLAVMPWNFPYWQVFRFAAPALMAGNAGVLKHSSSVMGCALAIEDIFRDAGFPNGIFRSLRIPSGAVDRVIVHDKIAAVTLTGSDPAGRAVASKAGECLKKTVLELGGSDPYIVLENANIERAAEACAASRLINSGQSCIAAKRFIVCRAVLAAFEQRFLERMRNARLGDPLADDTDVGPLARHDLRDALHDQVLRSVAAGARCVLGGKIPPGDGAFYPPTVLSDIRPGMPAFDEETFGPVAAIVPAEDEADAIRLANTSRFGLGAAIFTEDPERGASIAESEIEAGSVFVNGFVRSDPRLPFGGIKGSGYGRELSHYGIKEFTNVKTVWIA